jgi:hypothetical protein
VSGGSRDGLRHALGGQVGGCRACGRCDIRIRDGRLHTAGQVPEGTRLQQTRPAVGTLPRRMPCTFHSPDGKKCTLGHVLTCRNQGIRE